MSIIKIGVLGAANIAKRSVIPEIKKLNSNYELVGIASRNKQTAKEIATEFNTKPYFSYEELLNNGNLEAIYIPLPNSLHYEYAKKSLLKGIHVLVEKSLGCNLEQVKELVQLARQNNLLLMENFQFRFHPQLEVIKKLLDRGGLLVLPSGPGLSDINKNTK